MKYSTTELNKMAKDYVNSMIVDIMFDHPKFTTTIDKMSKKELAGWTATITELERGLGQFLLDKFGASDA